MNLRDRQTSSPAFRRWFGDSKVVDAQGNPLVVYHGSRKNFTRFSAKWAIYALGQHWFTSEKETAGIFSGDDGVIYPVYLAIRNPLKLHITRGMGSQDSPETWVARALGVKYGSMPPGYLVKQALRGQARDGLEITFEGHPQKQFVPVQSKQIKSATGNDGTFDVDDLNICS
jgi:hypothetical protein